MRSIGQPARRLAVAWSSLLGLAGLLVLSVLPGWPRISLITTPVASQTVRVPGVQLAEFAPSGAEAAVSASRPPAPLAPAAASSPGVDRRGAIRSAWTVAEPMWLPTWPAVLGGVFGAGMAGMLGWLALGTWQTVVIRRRSWRASASLQDLLAAVVGIQPTSVDLRVSRGLRQPLALGTWRPTIILPVRLLDAESAADLRVVLAHEWAHIANRDLWLIAVLRVLMPVLYAHPAYWWLRRQVRNDQEAVADAVASGVAGRLNYAALLLSWGHSARRFDPTRRGRFGRPVRAAVAAQVADHPAPATRLPRRADLSARLSGRDSGRSHRGCAWPLVGDDPPGSNWSGSKRWQFPPRQPSSNPMATRPGS